jgi:hypothetical protein
VLTRLLDRVFQDLKFEFVYHYLDDVVVYSESFEEHLQHLEIVLDRLKSAGLTVKPEKVVFATQEISFLGHVISPASVRVDPERTLRSGIFLHTWLLKGLAGLSVWLTFTISLFPG